MPDESHSRHTTGPAELVQAQTTSAPSRASAWLEHARTGRPNSWASSAATAAVRSASRPASRTSSKEATRVTAWAWARAWTPVPRIASVAASPRASRRTDSADPAAVRVAVMCVPSISATGRPSSWSNTAMSA